MKNIDKLREMSVEELAAFLEVCEAKTPSEVCDSCEGCPPNITCKYLSEAEAWKDWLEMEAS